MHSNWKIYKLLLSALMVFSLLGCKKEDPNPELRDPIYQDLVKSLKSHEGSLKSAEKSLETSLKELNTTVANTVERTVAKRAVKKAKKGIKVIEQQVKYFKIRSERRLAEGRAAYRSAFRSGKRWPDESEYKAYLANKKLISASRNWGTRVPKLFRGNPNYVPAHKVQKQKEKEK